MNYCPQHHDIAKLSFHLNNQQINSTLAPKNIDTSDLFTFTPGRDRIRTQKMSQVLLHLFMESRGTQYILILNSYFILIIFFN